ncbi:MAG: SDR family NAD(P)-dependent oxidoreductase [Myxococcota bacterium]
MPEPSPVLITEATYGLGRQTALELARRGRDVIVSGRRLDVTTALCAEIKQLTPSRAKPLVADLADLRAVSAACDTLGDQPLHGIVTHAGFTTLRDQRSVDGYELTFAINVLAHHLLLDRLVDQVVDGGRIVVLNSGVHEPDHRLAQPSALPIPRWVGARALARPDRTPRSLRMHPGPQRYGAAKLGNVLQARGFQARLRAAKQSVDVFALASGDTCPARETSASKRWSFRCLGRLRRRSSLLGGTPRCSAVSAGLVASLVEDAKWNGWGFAYLEGNRIESPPPDALREELIAELFYDAASMLALEPEHEPKHEPIEEPRPQDPGAPSTPELQHPICPEPAARLHPNDPSSATGRQPSSSSPLRAPRPASAHVSLGDGRAEAHRAEAHRAEAHRAEAHRAVARREYGRRDRFGQIEAEVLDDQLMQLTVPPSEHDTRPASDGELGESPPDSSRHRRLLPISGVYELVPW